MTHQQPSSSQHVTRPVLESGIPLLKRDATSFQLGLHPSRSVILPAAIATQLIALCNGEHAMDDIQRILQPSVSSETNVIAELFHEMLAKGLIKDSETTTCSPRSNLADTHMQTAYLHAVNQSAHPDAMLKRLNTELHIHGLGKLGMTVTTLLASSGFAQIRPHDRTPVNASDVTTFGAQRCDIGSRREHIALQIIERVQTGVTQRNHNMKFPTTSRLDLFFPDAVADYPWIDPTTGQTCVSADTPYLVANHAREHALVSAIIQPGQSGCIRCLHLHNADRDPAWPLLSTQLMGRVTLDKSPTSLVIQTALLVIDILHQWADGHLAARSSIYELAWPNPLPRIRLNPIHQDCGCDELRVA